MKKPVGRPRKKNAVKPGQLKNGLCYFSFIAKESYVGIIKDIAEDENTSIKKIMDTMLSFYLKDRVKRMALKGYLKTTINL